MLKYWFVCPPILCRIFRLIVRKGGFSHNLITTAKEGSILSDLNKRFLVGNPSAAETSVPKAVEKVITEPRKAFYYTRESVENFQSAQCKIIMAWKAPTRLQLAQAFPKNSRYRNFFKYAIFRLKETGSYSFLDKRWRLQRPDCRDDDRASTIGLGWEKVVSLFAVLAFGFSLACLICCSECVAKKYGLLEEHIRGANGSEETEEKVALLFNQLSEKDKLYHLNQMEISVYLRTQMRHSM